MRFTPTCVGNTFPLAECFRMRLGSPPRVWGILVFHIQLEAASSVHPHVCGEYLCDDKGNPRPVGSPPRVWGILISAGTYIQNIAVHPHVCGEYAVCSLVVICALGSPPRVWGIRHSFESSPGACPVHPHVCGEYLEILRLFESSIRFTPTCVGNTSN